MPNTQDGEKTGDNEKRPHANRWSGFIGHIKRMLHERRSEREKESVADKSARITASATRWMAWFTVVLALVGIANIAELQDQFVESERPYVWVNQVDPKPTLVAGKPAEWNFAYTNYGRSPAIGVRVRAQVVFGPKSPLVRVRKDLYDQIHQGSNDRIGTVMPPGLMDYSTASSNEILTDEDAGQIPIHDGGISLLVYIEYFDVRGTEHKAKFCAFRLASGALSVCPGEQRNAIE